MRLSNDNNVKRKFPTLYLIEHSIIFYLTDIRQLDIDKVLQCVTFVQKLKQSTMEKTTDTYEHSKLPVETTTQVTVEDRDDIVLDAQAAHVDLASLKLAKDGHVSRR